MIFFVLAGLCTFLAGMLWLEASRMGPWLAAGHRVRIMLLAAAVLVLVFSLVTLLAVGDGLVSSRVFRMVLGGLCGLMFALFWAHGGRTDRASADAPSTGGGAAPWWTRSFALLPVAVLVLFAYAALVPRGEINLGIIRSFKTPFIEAQFTQTQSEANLRLAIDRETQGFFRLNRAGLDEALNLARAELYYLQAIARGTDEDSREQKAAQAMEQEVKFLLTVLQPAALCVQQSFALYGSHKFLADALQEYGAGFSRALVLAKKADPQKEDDPFARQALDELLASIEELKPVRLRQRHAFSVMPEYTVNLCQRASDEVSPGIAGGGASETAALEEIKKSHVRPDGDEQGALVALEPQDVNIRATPTAVSPGDAGGGAPALAVSEDTEGLQARHRGDPQAALRTFGPKKVAELIQRPSVAHGIAVFFLWSGDPGAARTILSKSSSEYYDDGIEYPQVLGRENPYPGVIYIAGFVDRWLDPGNINPDSYLSLWRKTIDLFKRRLDDLEQKASDYVGPCTGKEENLATFSFSPGDLDISPVAVEQPLLDPAGCADPDECEARLAYGYFTYFVQKLRNHVVYESARELLAKKSIEDADVILDAALEEADDLRGFVDADGYRRGNCLTLQMTGVIGGNDNVEEKVTTSFESVDGDYAFFKDSAGLIQYARGVEHRSDEDYTAALRLFDEALRTGADDLQPASRAIIEEHRANALRALGVPD